MTVTSAAPAETDPTAATALALLDALNAHDLDGWERVLAPDFVAEYPCARGIGRQAARAFNQSFLNAIPDLHFAVQRVLPSPEVVVIQWVGTGTQTGPLATPSGELLPPTGRTATVAGVFLVEVRDGRIAREQTYWDELELLGQLGHIPGK